MYGTHVPRKSFLCQRLREPGRGCIGAGHLWHAGKKADSVVRGDTVAAPTGPPRNVLWLTVAGLRIHCLSAGTDGPAVMLLHGSGFDAAGVSFGATISDLAARCRVF